MLKEPRTRGRFLPALLVVAACAVAAAQQQPPPPVLPPWVAVKPIEPPASPLPAEAASASVTRFSFAGYGDTRSGTPQAGVSGDGEVVHPEHTKVVDKMIAAATELKGTPFPLRFVLQSGDAVLRGQNGKMFNVSFTPIIERLNKELVAITAAPDTREAFDKAGAEPLTGTPADLAAMIRDGVPKYANIVKTVGIKPE